jgi:hypothetical protein
MVGCKLTFTDGVHIPGILSTPAIHTTISLKGRLMVLTKRFDGLTESLATFNIGRCDGEGKPLIRTRF